jgi:hypothetical protein
MASHELYAKMEGFWTEFSENHSKFTEKGNKAAATRARKAVGELKKLVRQAKMQSDLTMIKKTLLDPDAGTIARVNQNTNFRKSAQKTLWSIWIALIGIIGKMIFWN